MLSGLGKRATQLVGAKWGSIDDVLVLLLLLLLLLLLQFQQKAVVQQPE
jgi:hypothetical protein